MKHPPIEIDQKFGTWTVLYRDEKRYEREPDRSRWMCECGCPKRTQRSILQYDLRRAGTHACACSVTRLTPLRRQLYNNWRHMKSRCYDRNNKDYHRYGGRDILVAPEWLDFDQFYRDMATTYRPGLTLERKHNDRGYSKGNCCWATRAEQSRNQRRNRPIETPLGRMLITEVDRHFDTSRRSVLRRLKKGFSSEEVCEFLTSRMRQGTDSAAHAQ
jgi:hypothetical protein